MWSYRHLVVVVGFSALLGRRVAAQEDAGPRVGSVCFVKSGSLVALDVKGRSRAGSRVYGALSFDGAAVLTDAAAPIRDGTFELSWSLPPEGWIDGFYHVALDDGSGRHRIVVVRGTAESIDARRREARAAFRASESELSRAETPDRVLSARAALEPILATGAIVTSATRLARSLDAALGGDPSMGRDDIVRGREQAASVFGLGPRGRLARAVTLGRAVLALRTRRELDDETIRACARVSLMEATELRIEAEGRQEVGLLELVMRAAELLGRDEPAAFVVKSRMGAMRARLEELDRGAREKLVRSSDALGRVGMPMDRRAALEARAAIDDALRDEVLPAVRGTDVLADLAIARRCLGFATGMDPAISSEVHESMEAARSRIELHAGRDPGGVDWP